MKRQKIRADIQSGGFVTGKTDIGTDRHKNRQSDGQILIWADRQCDGQSNGQRFGRTDRHSDGQTTTANTGLDFFGGGEEGGGARGIIFVYKIAKMVK